jgi:hypothetical protein
MANWSPFAPGTPGLVPIAGPNGTFQVPAAMAPAFGVQGAPPPTAPLPTFAPEELAPPAPPAPAPAPAPQPFALTEEESAALPAPPQPAQPQQPAAPPPPAPGSLTAQLANVEHQKDIALRQGAVDADVADQEAAALRASAEEEKRLTAERDAERARQQKEIAAARAKQADALDAFVNHKVDQNRAWHSKSTGQKVLAGIGVALAGIGGALVARDTGRPVTNPALDMIMGAIQDDVRLQMADRDKLGQIVGMKRQAVDDLRSQYSDSEAAYNAIVSGRARQVANQMAAIGASAKSEKAKLGAEAAVTQLNQAADTFALQAQEREAAAKQQAFDNRIKSSNNALGWAGHERGKFESDRSFAETQRQFNAQMDQRALDAAAKLAEAEAKAKGDSDEKARKEAEDVRDHGIGGFKSVKFNDKGLPEVSYEPFRQKDGTIFKASKINAPKLQMKKASVDNLVQLIDDTVNLIERHGQEADLIKSPAWQQMQANWGAMAIDEKTISELGVIAGPDMELIAKKLGSGDPTQFRDTTPGLRKARQNTLDKFDKELRASLYNGPKYTILEQTDLGVQDRIKNTPLENTAAASRGRVRPGDNPLASTADALQRSVAGLPQGEQLTPAALAGVAGAAALAKAGRPNAIALLQQMGNDHNPRMREAARDAAKKAGLEIAWPEEKK